jgi:hypothetical protein
MSSMLILGARVAISGIWGPDMIENSEIYGTYMHFGRISYTGKLTHVLRAIRSVKILSNMYKVQFGEFPRLS